MKVMENDVDFSQRKFFGRNLQKRIWFFELLVFLISFILRNVPLFRIDA